MAGKPKPHFVTSDRSEAVHAKLGRQATVTLCGRRVSARWKPAKITPKTKTCSFCAKAATH